MLFKDNLNSSLWPWHLSRLEVTSVIFAVVIGATELDVGYHLTVWVVSRSTFEEVICWGRFRVESSMQRMSIVSRTKARFGSAAQKQGSFNKRFLDEQRRRKKKTLLNTKPCFALFCFQHKNFITSFQSTKLFHFVLHFHHLQISHFDSNLCWLASQFRRACLTMTRFTYFNHTANLSQVWPQAWSSWTTLTGPSLMLASLSVLVGVP